jgi:DNA polymerase-3 subunit delta
MATLHVFDYLSAPEANPPAAVCVLFGDEPFLKHQARRTLRSAILGANAEDIPVATFEGDSARWPDVADELSTVSLFGGGARRLAIVENGDKFVSQNRAQLEDYVAKPSRAGTLVLEVDAWPGNTKLYKAIEKSGLQIDCRPPEVTRGRSKFPDEDRMEAWLCRWAKSQHAIVLDPRAARLLIQYTSAVFGAMDQDLAKLALYVPQGGKVSPELVQEVVGGWRAKTAWDMTDAACDGNAAEALLQLNRLLQAGDHPIAIFGQMSWSLRRYNAAVRIYERAQRAGERTSLADALQKAGFNDWPKGSLAAAESRLKQLGRERAGRFYRWLLDIDLALKGSHSEETRARLALEQLFLRMAARPASRS